MVGLGGSKLVRTLARMAFAECDLNGDGMLSAAELHIGLLRFYDKLNENLPVHVRAPAYADVRALLKRHDVDHSGQLSFDEFHSCVKELLGLGERRRLTDSLAFRIAGRTLAKLLVLPLAAAAIKRGLRRAGGEGAAKRMPDAALVLALEMVAQMGKLAFHKLADRE